MRKPTAKTSASTLLRAAKGRIVERAYKQPPAELADPLDAPEPIPTRGRAARDADCDRDVTSLCRALTVKAVRALEAVLDDPTAKHTPKIAAACQILNRGWGMPAQRMDITRRSISDMTEAELERVIKDEAQAARENNEVIPPAIAALLPK